MKAQLVATASPERIRDVPANLKSLDDSIQDLDLAISALVDRLRPVLSEESPEADDIKSIPSGRCDVADTLSTFNRRICNLKTQLRVLTERAEL